MIFKLWAQGGRVFFKKNIHTCKMGNFGKCIIINNYYKLYTCRSCNYV